MRLLDLTLDSIADNLALDEALLLEAEEASSGPLLRLWEWPHLAVVLGSGCKVAEDVDRAVCAADGVPVLRRSSGGGTVLLGAGCLCFTVVLPYTLDEALTEIRPSYHWILERVLTALALPGTAIDGISDLTRDGRKFSGNAQQRKRHHLLHHGTLLYAFDLPQAGRYLRMPVRQPEYRAHRPHDAFIRNLDVSRAWLVDRLRAAWAVDAEETRWPADRVRTLAAEKYSQREWNERR
ncbi:MAG: lipoate--protein ligase family protein [Gemmataceae bacterium]